jgi:hypothetical protein
MTDTDRALEARVAATLRTKVAQLPPVTLDVDAVSMAPGESPRPSRHGRVLVAASVVIVLLVVTAGIAIAIRGDDDSGRQPAGPPDEPVAARRELEARPTHSFQADQFTTIAGVNRITLVPGGGTESVQFEDPELADFRLSVPSGPSVGTVVLRAGRDYRIHSVIPGHTEAGVDAVIHVLPAGAPGTPPLPAAVLAEVSQLSRISGGPVHGEAEYAISTRNAAVTALMQDEIPGDEQPVYVFVLHGSFADPRAGGFRDSPSSTAPPTRTNVLTIVIPTTPPYVTSDEGTGPTQPDLSIVGGAISTRY